MNRWPLILFDLDGTLVDSFADIADGLRSACRAVELTVCSDAELLRLIGRGVPLEDFYLAIAGVDPACEPARFTRFAEAYRARYLSNPSPESRAFPGVADTLRALRAKERVIGVATTKRTESARHALDATGLSDLVDFVCGCDGIPPKPDPAVLLKVAAAAGVDVRDAVMVGDTDRDFYAARAAGCPIVAVTWGGFTHSELVALAPDFVISSMPQLLALLSD